MLVLDRINLEVWGGGFVSVLGPSGCGKSTLLGILAGLEVTSSGSVYASGKPVEGPHYSGGLVFQDPTLFPWLTVEGNLAFGPRARGEDVSPGVVEELLELTGLSEFRHVFPHQLSGGMVDWTASANQ